MVGTDAEESGGAGATAGALWDVGTAREEAERFVATALATASVAARELGRGVHRRRTPFRGGEPESPDCAGGSYATGSAECCVCPVCRVIAAMRDPRPELAERLATGAGDLAAGVASLLRSLTDPGSGPGADNGEAWHAATRNQDDAWVSPPPPAPEPPPDEAWPGADDAVSSSDDPWAAATRAARPAGRSGAPGVKAPGVKAPGAGVPGAVSPKPMAKKAVKPAVRPPASPDASAGTDERGDGPR
jgi:hypothetical protein